MKLSSNKFTYYFIKPYIVNLIIYFVLVCIATIFSISSILSVSNFLQILFGESTLAVNEVVNPSILDKALSKIYSIVISFGKEEALFIFGGIILVIYLFKDLFTYLSSYIIASTRNRVIRNIRDQLFKKYLSLPIYYIQSHKKGDLISRMSNDVIEYDENVLKSIQTLTLSITSIILHFVILFYIDYALTLTVIILFPIVASIVSFISRNLRKNSKHMQAKSANILSIIEETISGLRIIKAHSAQEIVNKRFRKFNDSYTRLRNKIYRRVDLASPMSEFLGNCMIIALLLIGSRSIVSDNPTITPAMFIVYLILFTLIIKPAKDLPSAFYTIKKGRACVDRLVEIFEVEDEVKEVVQTKQCPEIVKGIEYRNVSFSYKEGVPALKNINLFFQSGKTTAIVGSSGSGKSTIIDLIPKFYQPSHGVIYIDDVNLAEINAHQIRSRIAMVTQDTILFNNSVYENISFGGNYTRQEVIEAAKIANADEFIQRLPFGYDTNIGDRGSNLSGGQRQRISIARAILRNADILILDEATSALDTNNERIVQDSINKLTKGRTSIIIAHRLSTVINADKIIVMDKAEVKEEGTHQELLSLNGIYAKLCRMQELR